MAKKISAPDEKGFRSILRSFTGNLEDLFSFIISMVPVLKKYDQDALEKREKLKEILKGIPGSSGSKTHKNFSEDELEDLTREMIRFLRDNVVWPWIDKDRTELLYRTSFIMLLSYFNYLMSDIIHYYYKIYPRALSGKELTISLDDLEQCSDREEAIDFIIEKKWSRSFIRI